MPSSLVSSLEALVVGSVGMTARALSAAGLDVTIVQWRLLLIAGERPEGETVSEIARRISANLSPTSRLVSRLQRRGLVATSKDEADRRTTRVTLTDEGRELRSTVLTQRRREIVEALADARIGARQHAALARLAASFERFS